jgi:hypothetical protein
MGTEGTLFRQLVKKLFVKQSKHLYPLGKGDDMAGIDVPLDMWKHINDQEDTTRITDAIRQAQSQQQLLTNAQLEHQAQLRAQGQAFPAGKPVFAPLPETLAQRAREMFLKRMGGIRAEMKITTNDFLSCHVQGETVFVFYCFNGKAGVAEEAIDLFPSDQFITQFRLILS